MPQTSRQSKPVNVGIARWGAVGVIVAPSTNGAVTASIRLQNGGRDTKSAGCATAANPSSPAETGTKRATKHKKDGGELERFRRQAMARVTETGEGGVSDGTDIHGQPVASGVYFYQLQVGDYAATRKMIILK